VRGCGLLVRRRRLLLAGVGSAPARVGGGATRPEGELGRGGCLGRARWRGKQMGQAGERGRARLQCERREEELAHEKKMVCHF